MKAVAVRSHKFSADVTLGLCPNIWGHIENREKLPENIPLCVLYAR